jgi:hypothetical protein
MRAAAYTVRRIMPHGVEDTAHATHGEACAAYESARIESQGGVGLPSRWRVELWRTRGGKLITHTAGARAGESRPVADSMKGARS